MKLVAGLGNPGREYESTRHNVGFRVVDELARRWQIEVSRRSFSGYVGSGAIRGQQVLLLKPVTYMNRSGRSLREAVTFHKLSVPDVLVVTDDLALPLAKLRVRPKGSAGGHNGRASIIAELGSEEFARIRVGIEWVEGRRMVSHVLSPFSPEEQREMRRAVIRAADAVECWLSEGIDMAMNRFNRADKPRE